MNERSMTGFRLGSFLVGLPFALGAISLASGLQAQTAGDLVPGRILDGTVGSDGATTYAFQAVSAGVLTVVVRSSAEADLFLVVTDSDGQPLVAGRSDQDLGGDTGAEQFAVTLPRAGSYRVRVESFGGAGGAYKIGASWLSFPDLAQAPDPDGSPGSAIRIGIDLDAREDTIDGSSGDYWDWYVLKVDKGGTLTVATRAEEGDLILEAFDPGSFTEALDRSDQDLQGKGGNEAVTLVVEPGQELFFKVSAFSAGASVPYRLQVGFIPQLPRFPVDSVSSELRFSGQRSAFPWRVHSPVRRGSYRWVTAEEKP